MSAEAFMGLCTQCLERRLLRRVAMYPGTAVLVHLPLCLWCRLDHRDDRWSTLASTMQHLPHDCDMRQQARAEVTP